MTDILLCIAGAIIAGCVGIRFFFPYFGISRSLVALLRIRNTTKGYLIAHNINGFFLGIILIVAGIVPEQFKESCCMPLLGIVFISILVCNKIFVGSFLGPDRG